MTSAPSARELQRAGGFLIAARGLGRTAATGFRHMEHDGGPARSIGELDTSPQQSCAC